MIIINILLPKKLHRLISEILITTSAQAHLARKSHIANFLTKKTTDFDGKLKDLKKSCFK